MHLVAVNVETVRIGHPLPFPLMDRDGLLLARKAYVIESKEALEDFARRGGGLYIDVADAEAHHRAYVERLHGLVRDGKALGVIAGTQLSAGKLRERAPQDDEHPDWLDLQVQCNTLLRDTHAMHFVERVERMAGVLHYQSTRNADATLFALIHLSATETRLYSATHAMLVAAMCNLAAREVLHWSDSMERMVTKAALTMNLSMSELQDRLAQQSDPLTAAQRHSITDHAARSAAVLTALGVLDGNWLEAVREHHTHTPGALAERSAALQAARLIQRADMFCARLAPRSTRKPLSPAAAMQACYFDESHAMDEAGAALIKAVGIYPPGSFVRLATDEVAVVVRRGLNTTSPRVAVLVNRSGLPTVEPVLRDASLKEYKVVASVPHREVKVQINLERMLPLASAAGNDRPW